MLLALSLPVFLMLAAKLVSLLLLAPRHQHEFSAEQAVLHWRFRVTGSVLLAASLLGGVMVYRNLQSAPRDGSDIIGYTIANDGTSAPIRTSESQRYYDQIEMIGGKGAVWAVKARKWLNYVWQVSPGGCTLVILSTGGLLVVCVLLSRF